MVTLIIGGPPSGWQEGDPPYEWRAEAFPQGTPPDLMLTAARHRLFGDPPLCDCGGQVLRADFGRQWVCTACHTVLPETPNGRDALQSIEAENVQRQERARKMEIERLRRQAHSEWLNARYQDTLTPREKAQEEVDALTDPKTAELLGTTHARLPWWRRALIRWWLRQTGLLR